MTRHAGDFVWHRQLLCETDMPLPQEPRFDRDQLNQENSRVLTCRLSVAGIAR